MSLTELINWIDATKRLPNRVADFLVCFERNDGAGREVTAAKFDDRYNDGLWWVDGGTTWFGKVLYWAELPKGPEEGK